MPIEWFAFFSFKVIPLPKMGKEPQTSLQDLQSKLDELTAMFKGSGTNAQKKEWTIERSKLIQEMSAAKKVAAETGKQGNAEKQDTPSQATEKSTEKNSKGIASIAPKTIHPPPKHHASCTSSSTARKAASTSLAKETAFCVREEAPPSIREATSSSVGETAPAAR